MLQKVNSAICKTFFRLFNRGYDEFCRLMWCQNLEIKFYNLNAIYLDTKLLQSRQFFKQTWQERRQARNTYTCFQKYNYILLMMR